MNFEDLRKQHETELNNFSKDKIYYVFGSTETEVINKLKKEYQLEPNQVTSIGFGGYIKKEYYEDFNTLLENHFKEKREYTLANIYEVVQYYCWDYEMYISLSYDLDGLLTKVIGLTPKEVQANQKEINKAWNDYKREFEKLNL